MKMIPSFVERLASYGWTSWTIIPPSRQEEETRELLEEDEHEETSTVGIPWQQPENPHVFEQEWEESADRDPAWKEWKASPGRNMQHTNQE